MPCGLDLACIFCLASMVFKKIQKCHITLPVSVFFLKIRSGKNLASIAFRQGMHSHHYHC